MALALEKRFWASVSFAPLWDDDDDAWVAFDVELVWKEWNNDHGDTEAYLSTCSRHC